MGNDVAKGGGHSLSGRNAFYSTSFLIFITRFFPSFANLLVTLFYSKRLPVAVYGNYTHFWIQLNIFYPLICFGLHVLCITYTGEVLVRLLGTLKKGHYLVYAAWVLALSGAFAIIEWKMLGIPVWLSFVFAVAFSVSFLLESFLFVVRSFKVLVVTNVLYAAGYWAVHYYVFKSGFTVEGVFYGVLVVVLGRLLVYGVTAIGQLRHLRVNVAGEHKLPTMKSVRALWLHLGVYDVIQNLSTWVDKFIISILLTSASSAIYYNGSQNIPFLPLLLSAAGSAVLMQLASSKKQNEREDTIQLMKQSGRVLSCLVFPVFFYLFMFRREFIFAMFGGQFMQATDIFMLSVLVLPVRAYGFTTVLQRMHRGDIINIGAVSELVIAILLMYPLYQWIGLPGVALSFVVSTYLQAIFYLVWTSKLLNVSVAALLPMGNWLLKLIVFGSLLIAIHYTLSMYFAARFALILGGAVMAVMVMISLWIELKKGNRTARTKTS